MLVAQAKNGQVRTPEVSSYPPFGAARQRQQHARRQRALPAHLFRRVLDELVIGEWLLLVVHGWRGGGSTLQNDLSRGHSLPSPMTAWRDRPWLSADEFEGGLNTALFRGNGMPGHDATTDIVDRVLSALRELDPNRRVLFKGGYIPQGPFVNLDSHVLRSAGFTVTCFKDGQHLICIRCGKSAKLLDAPEDVARALCSGMVWERPWKKLFYLLFYVVLLIAYVS